MLKKIRLNVVLILLATFSWMLLTLFTFQLTAPGWDQSLDDFFHGSKILVKNIFLSLFFSFVLLFFKDLYKREREFKIAPIEWRVLAINIVCLFFHLIIVLLEHFITPFFEMVFWLNFLNNFNILIGTIFCANCFFYFKRLIFYQRTNQIHTIWKVFEIVTFSTILLTIFNVDITEVITFISLLVYAVLALYLSGQMRWVALLTKRKKIKSIAGFLVLIFTCGLIIQNFFFESFAFGENANTHLLVIDCAHKFFLLATFTFVSFYSVSSILILLFNIPTSSAFQQKVNDSNNYKRLSRRLHHVRDKNDVYDILLRTAMSTTHTKNGFVVLFEDTDDPIKHVKGLTNDEAHKINKLFFDLVDLRTKTQMVFHNLKQKLKSPLLSDKNIKSALANVIYVNEKPVGLLMLFKKIEDGFEKEAIEITDSYVLQASLSIENIELIDKAVESERYQEELKIAQSVKNKLLAKAINLGDDIDVAVFSQSTDHVGGDFYDFYSYSDTQSVVVLGDVSGHGTSAAFNMAQLKGVFQTAVRNENNFHKIPQIINQTLCNCLEKESFVTMAFFMIDKDQKIITHYRCGHNPSLFYSNNKINQLLSPGLGLGIIDDQKFIKITQVETFSYSKGDILLSYTDGFVESKNNDDQFFGLDRMEQVLLESRLEDATSIVAGLRKEMLNFVSDKGNLDDYSCWVIKF